MIIVDTSNLGGSCSKFWPNVEDKLYLSQRRHSLRVIFPPCENELKL